MTIPIPSLAAASIAIALCLLYVLALRRARASNRPLPARPAVRVWIFASGVACFFIACVLPGGSVFPEMIGHVLLAFAAPPLLLLGVPRQALLPIFVHRRPRRILRTITRPARAVVLFLTAFFLGYLPIVLNATLANAGLRFGMGLAIFATALLFWWPVIEPFPTWECDLAGLGKLLYLFIGSSVLKVLGFILAMVPRPIYRLPVSSHPLWGLSTLDDQQYAGWLMVSAGTFVLLAAATIICAQLLHDPDEAEDAPHYRGKSSEAKGHGQ